MSALWIAKPVESLSNDEMETWTRIPLPDTLAPSQTPSWGFASRTLAVSSIMVFSPDRRVSALFTVDGDRAECVNGPVFDETLIQTSQDLNERISMAVHALLRCAPQVKEVCLRPRLKDQGLARFLDLLAFPVDGVERTATLEIHLSAAEDASFFQTLPSRIRHEINRCRHAGCEAEIVDGARGLSPFWNKLGAFYQQKGLWLPPEHWARALIDGPRSRCRIVRVRHIASESVCEILNFDAGSRTFNLFAYNDRTPLCPNLSLNILAQWEAMCQSRRMGMQTYDLNGILHPDESTPDTAYLGVDRHKRKFKGHEVRYSNPVIRFG